MFPSKSTCIFCCLSTHCHWQCQMTLTSIGNKNCVFVSSAEFLLQCYLCKLLQPTYWQNQRTELWGWIMSLGVWCGIVAYFQVQWSIKWVELRGSGTRGRRVLVRHFHPLAHHVSSPTEHVVQPWVRGKVWTTAPTGNYAHRCISSEM